MRLTVRLGLLAGLFVLFALASPSAMAQVHQPKMVWGTITTSDAAVPDPLSITFTAYIETRPGETLTESSTGSSVETVGSETQYIIECGNFPTQWEAADVLVIEMNGPDGESKTASLTLVDTPGQEAQRLDIQLEPPGTLTVTSPDGGESWERSTLHNITWSSGGSPGTNVKLEYSTNGGSSWTTIEAATANDGAYEWTVPDDASSNCLVRVTSTTYPKVTDTSDAAFTILHSTLEIISPNGAENWERSTAHDITWTSSGSPGANVKLEYSTNGGSNWTEIIASTLEDGSHAWTVPDDPSANCLVRITSTTYSFITDTSDASFTILHSALEITSPNGGESWEQAAAHNVTWTSSGSPGANVKLEYSTNGGSSWTDIIASTPEDGTHSWTLPDDPSTNCLVRITSTTYSFITDTSDAAFTIVGSAQKLAFTAQPAGPYQAGQEINAVPEVTVQDSKGTTVTSSAASITVSIGTNPGGGTLSGTTARAAVNGVVSFPGLSINKTGTGYTLHAASAGLTAADSSAFDIIPAPVSASDSIVEATTPITADGSSTSTITITAKDAYGNPIPDVPAAQVVVASTGTGNTLTQPSSATDAGGQTTATLASTVAETKTVSVTISGTAITDTAQVVFEPGAVSDTESIVEATTPVTADGASTSTITITAKDAYGNPIPDIPAAQVVVVSTGTGNTLTQPSSATDAGGQTTATLASTKAETKTVSVTISGTAITDTAQVVFEPGPAVKLAFTAQPEGPYLEGEEINAIPEVSVQDARGNTVTSSSAEIIVAIGNNPSGGTLGGTLVRSAASGVASFPGLSIDTSGAAYTLHATSAGLDPADSNAFDIYATMSDSLLENYNFVSIPFSNTGITDAETLGLTIANCEAVWKWDAVAQSWSGHPLGGPNNFAVVPGEAYLVSLTAAATFERSGLWAAPTFTLKTGYNLISLPRSKESITTAEELAQDVPNCVAVWKWDASAQSWVGHPKGGPNNFAVEVGAAYLISVSADGTWP